jgi:hypothetical protein
MGKFLNDWVAIVDSSSVAVLSGLSRVLFMKTEDFRARSMTLLASVCFGIAVGLCLRGFPAMGVWRDPMSSKTDEKDEQNNDQRPDSDN